MPFLKSLVVKHRLANQLIGIFSFIPCQLVGRHNSELTWSHSNRDQQQLALKSGVATLGSVVAWSAFVGTLAVK
jgi:hypothetical protein